MPITYTMAARSTARSPSRRCTRRSRSAPPLRNPRRPMSMASRFPSHPFSLTPTRSPRSRKGTTAPLSWSGSPRRAGDAASLYRLSFGPAAPDEELSVHGLGVEVPIYLERDVIDLRLCVRGTLPRERRHPQPRQGSTQSGAQGAGRTAWLPRVCAVDGLRARPLSFTASLKLRTAEELLTKCAAHVDDGGVLNVPVKASASRPGAASSFAARASRRWRSHSSAAARRSSGSTLARARSTRRARWSSRSITRPRCRSASAVPLPKAIDVQPGDGLGTILPGERLTRRVLFTPAAATSHHTTLTLRTSLNKTYHLKCTGQGVLSELLLTKAGAAAGCRGRRASRRHAHQHVARGAALRIPTARRPVASSSRHASASSPPRSRCACSSNSLRPSTPTARTPPHGRDGKGSPLEAIEAAEVDGEEGAESAQRSSGRRGR